MRDEFDKEKDRLQNSSGEVMKQLSQQVDELQREIAKLKQQLEAKTKQVTELEGTKASLESKVSYFHNIW